MMIYSGQDLGKFLKNFLYLNDGQTKLPLSDPEEEDGNDLTGSRRTIIDRWLYDDIKVPIYTNEFWTSRQRQASSIHEVSYRACFKPQLPRFFIDLFTEPGDTVYDPFSGRGTTIIEAGLMGRQVISNDINPLSRILSHPRFFPPEMDDLKKRLDSISLVGHYKGDLDLSMFYHEDTLDQIYSLKEYLHERRAEGSEDDLDRWIRMVATNRLTGHSSGFFSVYTLPPNQAVSQKSQIRINSKRDQAPTYKDIKGIILKKSRSLLRNLTDAQRENLDEAGSNSMFLNEDARMTDAIPSESVKLTVTSPPFLNIVQYAQDNWLRCWFNSIDAESVGKGITMASTVEGWRSVMLDAFKEFHRITEKGGWVAFEVGEVRGGRIKLEEYVVPLGIEAGFKCRCIVINSQEFTKTSNIWGVSNMDKGTNTNRIVVFQKI